MLESQSTDCTRDEEREYNTSPTINNLAAASKQSLGGAEIIIVVCILHSTAGERE